MSPSQIAMLQFDYESNAFATPEEKLAIYSHALYEYTRQMWIDARRQAEIEAENKSKTAAGRQQQGKQQRYPPQTVHRHVSASAVKAS